jgi:hypothetical protein
VRPGPRSVLRNLQAAQCAGSASPRCARRLRLAIRQAEMLQARLTRKERKG